MLIHLYVFPFFFYLSSYIILSFAQSELESLHQLLISVLGTATAYSDIYQMDLSLNIKSCRAHATCIFSVDIHK